MIIIIYPWLSFSICFLISAAAAADYLHVFQSRRERIAANREDEIAKHAEEKRESVAREKSCIYFAAQTSFKFKLTIFPPLCRCANRKQSPACTCARVARVWVNEMPSLARIMNWSEKCVRWPGFDTHEKLFKTQIASQCPLSPSLLRPLVRAFLHFA